MEAFQYPCYSKGCEMLVKSENQSYSAFTSVLACFQTWTTPNTKLTRYAHSIDW